MRKVDDFKLLEMLKSGVQQKDIAAYFKVSPSYITKRKGQLEAVKEPESFSALTDKQKRFVLAKAEGKSNIDAAMVAFDTTSRESAKVLGSNTMKDPDVSMAIQDLLYQEGLGRRNRIKRLRQIVYGPDMSVALKGIDVANRLEGAYAPEKVDIDAQVASVHALVMEIRGMKKEDSNLLTESLEDEDSD